jgi:GT2 family glycosyltransferase
MISDLDAGVNIIFATEDMWWTQTVDFGINSILKYLNTYDRIILMNDDVKLDSNTLKNLISSVCHNKDAIIGAINLIESPQKNDKLIYFAGGHYDLYFARHKTNFHKHTLLPTNSDRFIDTDFIYGRLLSIPASLFLSTNIKFNYHCFPQYLADEAFTYESKLNGYKLAIDTNTIVYVNQETTAKFSLSFRLVGIKGIYEALTSFNSVYNLRQNWIFAKKFSKLSYIYIIFRFLILFYNENKFKQNNSMDLSI